MSKNNKLAVLKKSTESNGDGWETIPKKNDKKKNKNNNKVIVDWSSSVLSFDLIPQKMEKSSSKSFLLLLVGLPGSGKSTFAKILEQAMPYKYKRINQDELKNRKRCVSKAKDILQHQKGICPIIDRCNFDESQRQTWIHLATQAGITVECIVFQLPLQECIRRCQLRTNHETVQPEDATRVVRTFKNQFRPPGCRSNYHRNRNNNNTSYQHYDEVAMIRSIQYIRDGESWNNVLFCYLQIDKKTFYDGNNGMDTNILALSPGEQYVKT